MSGCQLLEQLGPIDRHPLAPQVVQVVTQLTSLHILSARPDVGKWPADLAAKLAAALPYCRRVPGGGRRLVLHLMKPCGCRRHSCCLTRAVSRD